MWIIGLRYSPKNQKVSGWTLTRIQARPMLPICYLVWEKKTLRFCLNADKRSRYTFVSSKNKSPKKMGVPFFVNCITIFLEAVKPAGLLNLDKKGLLYHVVGNWTGTFVIGSLILKQGSSWWQTSSENIMLCHISLYLYGLGNKTLIFHVRFAKEIL